MTNGAGMGGIIIVVETWSMLGRLFWPVVSLFHKLANTRPTFRPEMCFQETILFEKLAQFFHVYQTVAHSIFYLNVSTGFLL